VSLKILILDTSVLCCWLQVPGKETAGPPNDQWDYGRINELLETEEKDGSFFVLPIATLIETGNHIAQASRYRFEKATALADCLRNAVSEVSPWTAFVEQSSLWGETGLISLADSWPSLAASGTSIGDATIKNVAEYYASAGYLVEILTGDQGLKAYEPLAPVHTPRRRQ